MTLRRILVDIIKDSKVRASFDEHKRKIVDYVDGKALSGFEEDLFWIVWIFIMPPPYPHTNLNDLRSLTN